jgi:hypothetical protein
MASVGWPAFGRARLGSKAAGGRSIGRCLLALVSATALASSALALAWAGPLVSPARANTTGICDGCVVAWGDDSMHQTDFPTASQGGLVAVAAQGGLALALSWDGKVVAWGDNQHGQANVPAGLSNVVAISSGSVFAMALTKSGKVVAWGDDTYHETEIPAAAQSGIVRIAAGNGFGIAVKSDGTVVAWGNNHNGATNVPLEKGLPGVIYVPAPVHLRDVSASAHVLGIKQDGTVVAWGWNKYGQATVPAGLTKVKAVAAGLKFSLALTANGSLFAWGSNAEGELALPCNHYDPATNKCTSWITGFSAIAAGDTFALALKDGMIYTWGNVPAGLGSGAGETTWQAIGGGSAFGVGVKGKVGPPWAPEEVSGTPGNGSVQVGWAQPYDDGGAPVNLYTATASPGGKTCSTTGAVSCVVTGLTNGTAYTFTVKAHSGLGWGPASDPSAPVTPMAGIQLATLGPSVTAGAKGSLGLPGPSVAPTPGAGSKNTGGGGGIPLPFVAAAVAVVVVAGGAGLGFWLGRRGSV